MTVFDWRVDASATSTVGQIDPWRNNKWPLNALQYRDTCQSALLVASWLK